MPTQDQIDDILEKVATYQTKKAVSDAAQKAAHEAGQRAGTARTQWDAMIADGIDEPARLVFGLTELVESMRELVGKQATAQEATSETAEASTALNDAIFALTHVVASPPSAAAARSSRKK